MDALRQDVRLACRQLLARPAFTTAAIVTLAIGMGVNAVAFSVVNALLLKTSAAGDTPDVGRILINGRAEDEGNGSLSEFERYTAATRGVLTVAAEARLAVGWRHDRLSETAWALLVSDGYFPMLDTPVRAGRIEVGLRPDGIPVVVIGERFWRERLGAAPLAGLTLRLNNVDASVAGVVAESFRGPSGLYAPDVWMPLSGHELFGLAGTFAPRDAALLFLLARLEPGASRPEVQARLDAAAADVARESSGAPRPARFRSFEEANDERRALRPIAALAMAIIGLVLLLACFNVASLLLARGVERKREIGIRTALGARPGRLTRMLITEGMMLAVAAGAVTLVVARWTQSLVGVFAIPVPSPQRLDLSLDWSVAGFVAAIVALAGLLPGLWPALIAARVDISRAVGSQVSGMASGRTSALRRWLVTAQITGSTAFLAFAALCVQLYGAAAASDLGLERERLIIASVHPGVHGYDRSRSADYVRRLLDRTRALPGVVEAAVADRVPFYVGYPRRTPIAAAGRSCLADDCPQVLTFAAGPGLFRTLGRPILAGREFEGRHAEAREAIVNQAFAKQWWPDGSAVGQAVRIGPDEQQYVVVGIVADMRQQLVTAGRSNADTAGIDRPTIFLPLDGADYEGGLTIVARTAGAPETTVRPLVDAAAEVDPNIPIITIQTMAQRMEVPLWPFKTLRGLFSICGLLALVLATVGLASVVSHAVSSRLREFAVRLSIGATPAGLVVDVIRGSVAILLPGLVLGLVLGIAMARAAALVLPGLDVWNVQAYAAVAAAESAIVLLACLRPALRAARVDPMTALRA